jgi:hypothetical protein
VIIAGGIVRKYKMETPEDLEEVVNTSLNLRGTQGSGCVKGNGDGMGKDDQVSTYSLILNESKYTEKNPSSISVKKDDWYKTEKAAQRYGRIPIMTRGDSSGRVFVVMDLDDFSFIYKKALEFDKGN